MTEIENLRRAERRCVSGSEPAKKDERHEREQVERLVEPDRFDEVSARFARIDHIVRGEDSQDGTWVGHVAHDRCCDHERGRVSRAMVDKHLPGAGAIFRGIVV